ncbi:MAG: type II toxin-antitoxin system VapC family toxin [Gammaproteobacteria bacterium]
MIDTGAILALLDRDDRWHAASVEAFAAFRVPLITSAAVLTELFHLVGDNRHEVEAAWSFLHSGSVSVLPINDADMASLHALMKKYHDRPMDFADATLVHLAQRESFNTVFTVDFEDFETYRLPGRKRFRIFPAHLMC